MNNALKYIVIALLAALVALFFYNKYRVAPGMNFNKIGLSDLRMPVKISDFKGKKMIVMFSASWCGNCLTEMKALSTIKDSELKDVEIICISDEPSETIETFKEKKGYPFTFLKMDQTFNEIGINSIPTTYIINPQLDITYEKVGEINWKDPSTLHHMKRLME